MWLPSTSKTAPSALPPIGWTTPEVVVPSPQSIDVASLSSGIHSYRMLVRLFLMDGQQQFQASGSTEGRGYIKVADGDVFQVHWEVGHPPFLEIVPRPPTPGR